MYFVGISVYGCGDQCSTDDKQFVLQLEITTTHVMARSCSNMNFGHTITGTSSLTITASCIGQYGSDILFRGTGTKAVSPGQIRVQYSDCCWQSGFGGGSWRIFTEIDVSAVRTDTGKYNNAPQTTVPPRLALKTGCSSYQLPVSDLDGDRIECRAAVGYDECYSKCGYTFPGTITTDCKLDYNGGGAGASGGPYLVNLVIEDFDASNNKLSFVFMQFVQQFASTVPAELAFNSGDPFNVLIDTSGPTVFTATFEEVIISPGLKALIRFVDRTTGEVYHSIDTLIDGDRLQYVSNTLVITPTETFSDPMYHGKTISILLEEGVAGVTCRGSNRAVTDRSVWFVHIGKCKCYIISCDFGSIYTATHTKSSKVVPKVRNPVLHTCSPTDNL